MNQFFFGDQRQREVEGSPGGRHEESGTSQIRGAKPQSPKAYCCSPGAFGNAAAVRAITRSQNEPRGLPSAGLLFYGFVCIFPAMMSALICSNSALTFGEMSESN